MDSKIVRNWKKLGAAALILLTAVAGAIFLDHYQYEKFEANQNFTQERVYASCHCIGISLLRMQSYPPQFGCTGVEVCRPVNYTRESSVDF